jgi:hypothetical protein
VKRNCFVYKSSNNANKHICIDINEAEDIYTFISQYQKKFDYITNRILETNFIYYDDYEQIEGDITAMRFFPNGINVRIYCKEVKTHRGIFYIIMSKVLKKKSGKINKTIQSKIDALKSYDYEIE